MLYEVITFGNYVKLESNEKLKQMIVDEYELRKEYLNFKLIY